MQIDQVIQFFRSMTWSDWGNAATCLGALLGTLAFIWDVEKHLSRGPKLKLKAWYHPDPHSSRVLIRVEIRNTGDAATRIEYIDASQDGRRFERGDHIAAELGFGITKFKDSVAPNDNFTYQIQPFDRAEKDPPAPGRKLDGSKPALVYVRAAAFEKELVAKVRPLPREA